MSKQLWSQQRIFHVYFIPQILDEKSDLNSTADVHTNTSCYFFLGLMCRSGLVFIRTNGFNFKRNAYEKASKSR